MSNSELIRRCCGIREVLAGGSFRAYFVVALGVTKKATVGKCPLLRDEFSVE